MKVTTKNIQLLSTSKQYQKKQSHFHMHPNMSSNWTFLQRYHQSVSKDRHIDISIGDLPPQSPQFCSMLPSLRSSPAFPSKNRQEDDDSFHVVPSCSADKRREEDNDTCNDTYGNFLKHLQREDPGEDIRYGESFVFSPDGFEVPESFMRQDGGNSPFEGDDLQIYLPNEISPTPVDKLYSTLEDEKPIEKFSFPCLDENERLENFDVQTSVPLENVMSPCIANATLGITASTEPRSVFLTPRPQKRKLNDYTNIAKRCSKSSKIQNNSEVGRPTHNDIERQRRNDMKARFDALKSTVPDIENMERTPKILILSKAAEFIRKLHGQEKQLDVEKERERKRNRMLLEKLVQLTNV